ncbi:phage portal protein [Caulobacter segnis]|uniref:Phage portal protein n=1 Tax=Caulobacter segnis TaxID=88688 RepID=A0A2W5X805_9CAUL|nr:phage portal protein [Caulobacter segnis]PZR37164.1 MAG: phage portal protein [Caulobacter segnis]
MARAKKAGGAPAIESFSFGDPEPVLGRRDILSHIECWNNGRFYEPPVRLDALTRAYRVGPHHESAINYKVNLLTAYLEETPLLDPLAFEGFALDYLVLGNGYLEKVYNRLGGVLRLDHPLGKYMRRGVKPGVFFSLAEPRKEVEFEPDTIVHLKRADLNQNVYGLPEYLGALQSAFLNEAATLFRRKYYLNGSHVGFILRSTDQNMTQEEVDALKQKMKEGKGPGNFRNLFVHAPGGKEKGIEVIPISEVAAKDEFMGIKNTSRDDVLAAHRVPPQLLGMVPANAGGFGDVDKASEVFERNEIKPLMRRFTAVNRQIGAEVIRFRPFRWELEQAA